MHKKKYLFLAMVGAAFIWGAPHIEVRAEDGSAIVVAQADTEKKGLFGIFNSKKKESSSSAPIFLDTSKSSKNKAGKAAPYNFGKSNIQGGASSASGGSFAQAANAASSEAASYGEAKAAYLEAKAQQNYNLLIASLENQQTSYEAAPKQMGGNVGKTAEEKKIQVYRPENRNTDIPNKIFNNTR